MRDISQNLSPQTRKIRVLVVDDSAIVRKILAEALSAESDIEVVGTAPDPYVAREKILALDPDVLTLDIEMPRMDGVSFLRKLMQQRPMPVVIISSIAQRGCAAALSALESGAVEVLAKPGGPFSVGDLRYVLPQKIRAAARAQIRSGRPPLTPAGNKVNIPASGHATSLIVIGASTGGTEALRVVLEQLPENCPPILVVQHIPAVFSRKLAERLNELCRITVRETEDGDAIEPGTALLAPGGRHMLVRKNGQGLCAYVNDGPRVCYQRPSVDVLFHSAAQIDPRSTIALILTGMGTDGAEGMLRLKHSGARTIAQDEATSVVYGMPREAVRLGAVDHVLALSDIGPALCRMMSLPGRDQPVPGLALARR